MWWLGSGLTADALVSHQTVIEDDCLPMDQFAVHLMPHLLTLANDRVPNVRVLLAKTLRQTLLEKGGWWLTGCVNRKEATVARPAWHSLQSQHSEGRAGGSL